MDMLVYLIVLPSQGSTVIHEEGYLMRKHEWEDQEKKAMDR